jgi:hypothetical protein
MGLAIAITLGATFMACDKNNDNISLRSKDYTLVPVGQSGVTGKVTISENANKTFNVLVVLNKSVKDTVHISHIHTGSISSPGAVAISLSNILGTGTTTQATTANVNTITYDSVLNYNGYINVHYSASRLDSLIAQVNIGKNSP